ncbi:NAD-dependent epimerase/dehydratase family protein [Paenibacillus beijingensis]|uniref:UDP-glucose epimerase n=1 Tax=Paenibacillus beijingensis TaxID=1126833 RepID=A0A0D5NP25_9BACL|nr:NAD-dependent epimerase/dehydratase family protein [Paenibacillus beijingensis]AJY76752.1 UDP-glucose epimerase [Paenibacillus beijingensis]
MNILVTGAGGFIGSHLCEHLLIDPRNTVIGLDDFVREELKTIGTRNIALLLGHPRFRLIKANMLSTDWLSILQHVDAVYHLAGIPGVRASWGSDFKHYVGSNIMATQQLLEACRMVKIRTFVYASTSSVYGEQKGKVSEDASLTPLSPYGVSKLTGEYLCHVYRKNYQVPVIILRYFTVYGPRQRSDMAFHRFIKQLLASQPVTLIGDGSQTRDFTYVSDCASATASVLGRSDLVGETINIGGKERASISKVIETLETIAGLKADIVKAGEMHGEPMHTWADISKAQRLLGYSPKVGLTEGLQRQLQHFSEFI